MLIGKYKLLQSQKDGPKLIPSCGVSGRMFKFDLGLQPSAIEMSEAVIVRCGFFFAN